MLTATPKSFFSGNYVISRDGEPVAELDLSHWRERGSMAVEGKNMRFYKEGLMKETFVLELDGHPLAQAVKPSVWRTRFELRLGDVMCEVRRGSLWRPVFEVWRGDERIGEVAREGWCTRRTRIELPEAWPAALQVFVFWLVLMMWRRDNAAAGS